MVGGGAGGACWAQPGLKSTGRANCMANGFVPFSASGACPPCGGGGQFHGWFWSVFADFTDFRDEGFPRAIDDLFSSDGVGIAASVSERCNARAFLFSRVRAFSAMRPRLGWLRQQSCGRVLTASAVRAQCRLPWVCGMTVPVLLAGPVGKRAARTLPGLLMSGRWRRRTCAMEMRRGQRTCL